MSVERQLALVCTAAIAWGGLTIAAEPASSPGNGQGANQARILALEAKLFHPSLSTAEVDGLLKALPDSASRSAAVKRLIAGASGMQDGIAANVADETDMDIREAAADVVEGLDASYQQARNDKRRRGQGVAKGRTFFAKGQEQLAR